MNTCLFIKQAKTCGVEDTGSHTVTSKLGGAFRADPAVRAEFLNLAHR